MRLRPLRTTVLVTSLGLAACGRPPAPDLEATGHPVEFAGARETGPAVTASVTFLSSREALAPLALREAIAVDAEAGKTARVELPVPSSTQAVWARVSLLTPGTIEAGGAAVPVTTDTLVAFPLTQRTLTFRSERAGRVMIQPIATVDSAGGGFAVEPEPPVAMDLGATTPLRLADAPTVTPDDTFARLVRLEASSEQDSLVRIGRCGPNDDAPASTEALLTLSGGGARVTTAWLPAGPLCVSALKPARLTLTGLGRVRRFAQTSLRATRPVTVLDTARGVGGWSGRPGVNQTLRVSLGGLVDSAAATHRLLSLTLGPDAPAGATATVGVCGDASPPLESGALVLLRRSDALCVTTSGRFDVKLTLIAEVTGRSEAIGQCGPRPAAPACAATDLLGKLNCISGISATPYTSMRRPPGTEQFLLRITQPVDHFRPDGTTFEQRALLTVRSEDAPMVLHTTGYDLYEYFSDVSAHFPTNEIELEHRFFNDSTPAPLDYSTLTIMQSAYDSHRVVELLNPLFTGPWVNTGHSKGGMTALSHRRFFPCDVVASAPYVTPLSLGKQDPRYGPWLAELGGPQYADCRQAFVDLERGVIRDRALFAARLKGTYTRIGGREEALWALANGDALWPPFQQGTQDDNCPLYVAIKDSPYFADHVAAYADSASFYSDESLGPPLPFGEPPIYAYYYQTQNELGAPGGNRAHLAEFGPVPPYTDPIALAFGSTPLPQFEARAMPDVQRWLTQHGERFFFLYGGFDPWTGGRVDTTGLKDSVTFIVPGAPHGVSLADMPEPEREQAFLKLEQWLGVKRAQGTLRSLRGERVRIYRDVMHRYRL